MLAKKIRDRVQCNDLRICVDKIADAYGVKWYAAELPKKVQAMCAPHERIVLVSRRLGEKARRFYLCHEIVECLNPISIVHGSLYNEVAGHVLVPPWLLPKAIERCKNDYDVANEFDVPVSVARYQIEMILNSHGKSVSQGI